MSSSAPFPLSPPHPISRHVLSAVTAPTINLEEPFLRVWLLQAPVEPCQGAYMVSALSFLTPGVIPQVPNLHIIHFPTWDFLQE